FDPGLFQGLPCDLVQLRGGPAEDRLPLLVDVLVVTQEDRVGAFTGRAPHHRADPVVLGGRDHCGAGAVGEDHTAGTVFPIHPFAELFGTDHQRVAGTAGPHRVRRQPQRVAKARAGGVDVEGAGGDDAELGGHGCGGVGDLVPNGTGGHDYQVDVGRGHPAGGHRLATSRDRHTCHGLLGTAHTPFLDAHTALDPLVGG